MKGLRNCTIALLLGCCAPILIWVGLGSSLYQLRKQTKLQKEVAPDLACSIDADCPPGYVCINGQCVLVR